MKRRTSLLSRFTRLWGVLCAAVILGVSAGTADAQGYQIRSGDKLTIEVLEDPSLNRTVLVAPDGRISVPTAGTIRVSGQSVETVQRNLVARLAGNFASPPNVFVSIAGLAERRPAGPAAAPKTISVYVLGETNKPGKLDVEPGTNVLQMFAMMGGFTKFAATKRIQLRRTDKRSKQEKVYRLNYDAIEAGSDTGQTTLRDGDVIVIPQRRLFE